MITEEMLCAAAARSCEIYVSYLERGYTPENQHEFSLQFEKKIKKLKWKADHPVFYHATKRIASIVLAILITGGVWIAVDAEARAAFVGWVKEVYEEFFVYRFNDETDIQNEPYEYEFTWLPNGYVKLYEKDTGSRITRLYKNEAGQMLQFNYVYDPNETDIYVIAPTATVDDAVVNGYAADFIISGDERAANVLMWIDSNNCAFYISAYLEKEDLVNLAESLYEK